MKIKEIYLPSYPNKNKNYRYKIKLVCELNGYFGSVVKEIFIDKMWYNFYIVILNIEKIQKHFEFSNINNSMFNVISLLDDDNSSFLYSLYDISNIEQLKEVSILFEKYAEEK